VCREVSTGNNPLYSLLRFSHSISADGEQKLAIVKFSGARLYFWRLTSNACLFEHINCCKAQASTQRRGALLKADKSSPMDSKNSRQPVLTYAQRIAACPDNGSISSTHVRISYLLTL
jgi:hypothetical protein